MIEDSRDKEPPAPHWGGLRLVAKELQRWLETVPMWPEGSDETWDQYLRRHAKAEQELTSRLRRLPGCTITRSTTGSGTTLLLAGVQVRSQAGLAGACRDWVAMVRTKADDGPSSGDEAGLG